MHPLSIESITKAFLDDPSLQEQSLSARLYLVEKLLPTLVPALEKLLQTVERRSRDNSSSIHGQHPPVDPLNYLAQYLFRHNPKQSRHGNTAYTSSLQQVATELRESLKSVTSSKSTAHSELSSVGILKSSITDIQRDDLAQVQEAFELAKGREEPLLSTSLPASRRSSTASSPAQRRSSAVNINREHHELLIGQWFDAMVSKVPATENGNGGSGSTKPQELSAKRYHKFLDIIVESPVVKADMMQDKWRLVLPLIRLPVTARSLLTTKVTLQEFTVHVLTQLESASLSAEDFDYLIEMMKQVCKDTNKEHEQGYVMTQAEYVKEQEQLTQWLATTSNRMDMDPRAFLREATQKLSFALQREHPILNVYISFTEQVGATQVLKFAAATPKDESLLLGQYLSKPEAPVSFDVVFSGKIRIVENIRASPESIKVFGDAPAGGESRNGSFLACPIEADGKCIGVLGADTLSSMSGKIRSFDSRDAQFFEVRTMEGDQGLILVGDCGWY